MFSPPDLRRGRMIFGLEAFASSSLFRDWHRHACGHGDHRRDQAGSAMRRQARVNVCISTWRLIPIVAVNYTVPACSGISSCRPSRPRRPGGFLGVLIRDEAAAFQRGGPRPLPSRTRRRAGTGSRRLVAMLVVYRHDHGLHDRAAVLITGAHERAADKNAGVTITVDAFGTISYFTWFLAWRVRFRLFHMICGLHGERATSTSSEEGIGPIASPTLLVAILGPMLADQRGELRT